MQQVVGGDIPLRACPRLFVGGPADGLSFESLIAMHTSDDGGLTRGRTGTMLAAMCAETKDPGQRSLKALARIQKALIERLAEYIVENEPALRLAAEGVEGYGYAVHQIDELFLTRLNIIERAIAEIQKGPNGADNRYRTLCFRTSSSTVEEEINSRLERLPEARVLGVSVSPASNRPPGGPMRSSAPAVPVPEDISRFGPPEGADGAADQVIVTVLYYGREPQPSGGG
jgi:hypothetical protein